MTPAVDHWTSPEIIAKYSRDRGLPCDVFIFDNSKNVIMHEIPRDPITVTDESQKRWHDVSDPLSPECDVMLFDVTGVVLVPLCLLILA